RVNNFTKARVSLQIIGRDLTRGILREQLTAFPVDSGATVFRFITQAKESSTRDLSVIEYYALDFADTSNHLDLGLWRRSLPLSYTDSLPYNLGTLNFSQFTSNSSRDDQLGPGILLFRYQFKQNNGQIVDNFNYNYSNPSLGSNCRLVIVSLLVLDETALQQLDATNKTSALINHFTTGSPAPNELYRERWMGLRQANPVMNSMPESVRDGIEIFERSYVLHPSL
ncbi:MAG: hypothetical protein AAF558_02615, partial [Verrucomicrobiota bacterium]